MSEDLRTDWQKENAWHEPVYEDQEVAGQVCRVCVDPGGGYRENGRYYGVAGGDERRVICKTCGDLITVYTYVGQNGKTRSFFGQKDCNRCHPKTPLGGLPYK